MYGTTEAHLDSKEDNTYFKKSTGTLDGGIGKFSDYTKATFGIGLKNSIENTEWIAFFISTLGFYFRDGQWKPPSLYGIWYFCIHSLFPDFLYLQQSAL